MDQITKLVNHLSVGEFYQNIEEFQFENDYLDKFKNRIGHNFTVLKNGIYTNIIANNMILPVQGWKIHISSNVLNAVEILNIVFSLLENDNFCFKFISSEELLQLSTQKFYSRSQSGKFITIYTKDEKHFINLIEKLYVLLKNYDGTFVLSDKRYKDCKVLYYRYGGYQLIKNCNNIPCILAPNGLMIEDKREVYYSLPYFVDEPFENFQQESDSYLFNNFTNIKPLRFTNSGGIYTADYVGENVILKEARPNTCISIQDGVDSIQRRKNEVKFLRQFSFLGVFPKVYNYFFEWEHYFLVEEYIDGKTLKDFSINNNPFLNQNNIDETKMIVAYVYSVVDIIEKLLNIVKSVHSNGYILADLSLENVMISDEGIKIVDLESAFLKNNPPKEVLSTLRINNEKLDSVENIDYYAVSCLLYDLIFQKSDFQEFGFEYMEKYLSNIISDFRLNPFILEVWKELRTFDRVVNVSKVCSMLVNIKSNPVISGKNVLSESNNFYLNSSITDVIDEFILNRTNAFPYSQNKFELDYGLAGAVYIFGEHIEVPTEKLDLYSNLLIVKSYESFNDIGLISGTLGYILALSKVKIDAAQELMNTLMLKYNLSSITDFSIGNGLSGYGVVLLKLWKNSKNNLYLAKAIELGEKILAARLRIMENKSIGLFYGASGISYFLILLYNECKDHKFLSFGKELLERDLSYALEERNYIGFPKEVGSLIALPYLDYGTAGIIFVLLRYYLVTKDNFYKIWIDKLSPSLNIKYAILPGLFDGLSGIGHVVLDLYAVFSDEKYLSYAKNIKDGILLHQVQSDRMSYYPNQITRKIDFSFATGNLGILSYLYRFDEKIPSLFDGFNNV